MCLGCTCKGRKHTSKAGHFAHLSAAMGVDDVRKMERRLSQPCFRAGFQDD